MRRSFFLLSALILLTISSCGNEARTTVIEEPTALSAPQSCELPLVVATVNSKVPGATYIPSKWDPQVGTDLYDIYQLGGIACSYGVQSAEIGATVMWAQDRVGRWGEKSAKWLAEGQSELEIDGVKATAIVGFADGFTSADGRQVQIVNVLSNGVWIHLNANFVQNLNDLAPLINSAIDSLHTN